MKYLIQCMAIFGMTLLAGGTHAQADSARVWFPHTIDFAGPSATESDSSPNPFLDYRLTVTFRRPDGSDLVVPGFFDGDGQGGGSGGVWRTRISPDAAGTWEYTASFRSGNDVAVDLDPLAGSPAGFDGQTGSFEVLPRDSDAPGFLASGAWSTSEGTT